jgi:hypothetical protein
VILKLRQRMTYANVMATVAVFLALGGGAYAALKRNSVGSKQIKPNAVKGVDANEATFGQVPSAKSAATAKGVATNSVGAPGIQDPIRSVNLPLASFVNTGSQETIDFTVSDGTSPDFINVAFCCDFVIEYDDDSDLGGADLADSSFIASTFAVPPDYASGGSFVLRVSKDAHTAIGERLNCDVALNGNPPGGGAQVTTTTAANTSYTLTPAGTYAPGDAALVRLRADDAANTNNHANDRVFIHSVEFRYTATQ